MSPLACASIEILVAMLTADKRPRSITVVASEECERIALASFTEDFMLKERDVQSLTS